MNPCTFMSLLMERSLSSEHFLLKSFFSYSLTWCLTANLSYPTAGKMAVSTSMDIDAIINQMKLRMTLGMNLRRICPLMLRSFPTMENPRHRLRVRILLQLRMLLLQDLIQLYQKQKVKIVEPKKDVKTFEEDDSSEEDDFGTDSSEDELESDEDEDGDSESGEGDTEDDDEEETPRKVELSNKRPAASATATQDKKAKFVTPQKTETKKSGGHVDTPYPSKQAGKTPANQLKQQTPKPAGSHPCKSCSRSFNSENALDSHTKAKHTPVK